MELQQLRYVLAVAQTKHFTRAAQQCHVVQSALSHQIAALERELGFALFARTSRKVDLTPAGLAFLPHARASLEAAERAAVDAASAHGVVRGRLVIGMIPTVASVDVPAALVTYREAYPEVRVSIRVEGSERLIEGVRRSALDVAFLGLPDRDVPGDIGSRLLAEERLVAVVPERHPLAGRKRVPLEQLVQESFADFPGGTSARRQSDRAFEAAGLTRDVAYESMGVDLIVALVAHGLAVALLPESIAERGHPGITSFAVTPPPTRFEHLVWNEFNPTPAATAFLRQLRTNG